MGAFNYQWLSLELDSRELFKGISIRNLVVANEINGTIWIIRKIRSMLALSSLRLWSGI